jgi:GT2 family glycosyltransferase
METFIDPMTSQVEVTVILTIWKRYHLEEQLQALAIQTVPVKNIWIYQCGHYVDLGQCLERYPNVKIFHSDVNLKYFGRFTLAAYSTTEYTWILDDDVIPSSKWIETSIETSRKYNAVVSGAGRIIVTNDSYPDMPGSYELGQQHIGDGDGVVNSCEEDTLVDFGCNGWFFRTEWLRYFWMIWPFTFQNGEDIHLSAAVKIHSGISTVVPYQSSVEVCGNLNKKYNRDQHSSFLKEGFYEQRIGIVKHLMHECKWEPLFIAPRG